MSQEPIAIQLFNELSQTKNYQNSRKKCADIIQEIENTIQKRILVYYSSYKSFNGIIDKDADFIEDLLKPDNSYSGLVLILNSPGGQAIAAEKIINVCKAYSEKKGGDFVVIVPKMAKSAATIVALGADKIILRKAAELGPVDPQIVFQQCVEVGQIIKKYKKVVNNPNEEIEENKKIDFKIEEIDKKIISQQQVIPAFRIYNAVSGLLNEANKFKNLNKQSYNQFLKQYKYDLFEMSKNEIELSKDIIKKILKQKKGQIVEQDFEIFLDPQKTYSHRRPITITDLESTELYKSGFIQDFNHYYIKNLSNNEEVEKLDNLIWEYYIRTSQDLEDDGNPVRKVIQTSAHRFDFPD